jgi:hypothetical protein
MRVMSRSLLIVLAVAGLALAACGSRTTTGSASATGTPILASFAPDSRNVVQVAVQDRRPVDQVELLAPDGRVYLAHTITRDQLVDTYDRYGYTRGYPPGYYEYPYGPRMGVGVGVFGGSSGRIGTSIGLGFPLGGGGTVEREVGYKSIARIPIDDMGFYAATWRQWRMRISFAEPAGGARYIEIEAPPPPSAQPPR